MHKSIQIELDRSLGLTAPIYIHEAARKVEGYSQPIIFNQYGKTTDGQAIAINTLGRWLFGVPGYDGTVQIIASDNTVTIHYPQHSAQFIDQFMNRLKHRLETNHVNR